MKKIIMVRQNKVQLICINCDFVNNSNEDTTFLSEIHQEISTFTHDQQEQESDFSSSHTPKVSMYDIDIPFYIYTGPEFDWFKNCSSLFKMPRAVNFDIWGYKHGSAAIFLNTTAR